MQAATSHVQKGEAIEDVAMEDPEAKRKALNGKKSKKPEWKANLDPEVEEEEQVG